TRLITIAVRTTLTTTLTTAIVAVTEAATARAVLAAGLVTVAVGALSALTVPVGTALATAVIAVTEAAATRAVVAVTTEGRTVPTIPGTIRPTRLITIAVRTTLTTTLTTAVIAVTEAAATRAVAAVTRPVRISGAPFAAFTISRTVTRPSPAAAGPVASLASRSAVLAFFAAACAVPPVVTVHFWSISFAHSASAPRVSIPGTIRCAGGLRPRDAPRSLSLPRPIVVWRDEGHLR
ncbi:hypothetical protein, partial [Planobispora takensis]|uniref:hypothetical protein n=1 Tax=Planobispora takensis TaxID=1367882 RepID=UPI0035E84857